MLLGCMQETVSLSPDLQVIRRGSLSTQSIFAERRYVPGSEKYSFDSPSLNRMISDPSRSIRIFRNIPKCADPR